MNANVRACTRQEVEQAHGPALNVLAHQLARDASEKGEELATQMAELFKDPCPERCARVAMELASAQALVQRLAAELMRGEPQIV